MNISDIFTHLGAMAVAVIPLVYLLMKEKNRSASVRTEISFLRTELEEYRAKASGLEEELKASAENRSDLNADISRLEETLKQERKSFAEKTVILDEAKKSLGLEFQNLGGRIFEDAAKKFTDRNKTEMENILNPLRERIRDFDRTVAETHESATKQRTVLETHIKSLESLGEKMSEQALNLTTALKGESQTQGAWGEMLLARALEMSGLREGQEYLSQPVYSGREGNALRPDVVVRLPEGKDVVIDSKVSLTAYEKYTSCESGEEKERFLREHVASLRTHVKELGSKSYENIAEIRTLNYVLMFVPLESAFMAAMEKERELYREAFEKNIIIVCPSTLLATLRTIQSIWQFEYQNANAREIAESAGKMYDKFATFVEHLQEVGKRISQSGEAYENAMKGLFEGRGNLVKRASDLREMGVKTRKELPSDLVEKSKTSEEVVISPAGPNNDPFSSPRV